MTASGAKRTFKIRQSWKAETASIGTLAVPFAKNEATAFQRITSNYLLSFKKPGASERIRSVDPNLGN